MLRLNYLALNRKIIAQSVFECQMWHMFSYNISERDLSSTDRGLLIPLVASYHAFLVSASSTFYASETTRATTHNGDRGDLFRRV